jgi:hypothetical protein
MNLPRSTSSFKQLSAGTQIVIDRWVEFGTSEWLRLDDDVESTRYILGVGEDTQTLLLDELGGVWTAPQHGSHPFHIEANGQKIGIRLPNKALN